MKGLAITSRGLEETACTEIGELIGARCEARDGCVIFEFKGMNELCMLCYKCQSVDRILYLVGQFQFGDFFEELEKFIGNADFEEWFAGKNFKVECTRTGNHHFNSVDAEEKAASLILEKSKEKIKVDRKDYEVIFFLCIVDDACYFGIDFAGFELNKRGYKAFMHQNSLRGTIAYALVRESGFKKNGVMLDPFSRDGVIAIEAAFHASGLACNYFNKDKFAFLKLGIGIDFERFFEQADKQAKKPKAGIHAYGHLAKFVDSTRKNAKIAGVEKYMEFSRTELEWLDIKFKESSVDAIVTNPPGSKSENLDKVYNEFFYQCAYILKKEGAIATISAMPDFVKKHAEKHNFIVSKEKEVWSGSQMLNILVFKKKSA